MIMNEIVQYFSANSWIIVIICAVAGYLTGSVSFARIIYYLVTREKSLGSFAEPVPHSDETFESDLVSATLVGKKLGARFGCATSIADMLKVALPTLLVRIWFPEHQYHLVLAVFGVMGHNYPLYHGFRGGRGESPIFGVLFVVNWFGVLIVNVAATVLGFITGSVLVIRFGGYVLLIFWFWYYFNDLRYVVFIIILNFFYWFSMRKDLARFNELKKSKGLKFTEEDVSEFILMGRSIGRMLDKYSLYALWKNKFNRKKNINDHPEG